MWQMGVCAADGISHSHWSLLAIIGVCVSVRVCVLDTGGVRSQLTPVLTSWPCSDLSVWLRWRSRGSRWPPSWPKASTCACSQPDGATRANGGRLGWVSHQHDTRTPWLILRTLELSPNFVHSIYNKWFFFMLFGIFVSSCLPVAVEYCSYFVMAGCALMDSDGSEALETGDYKRRLYWGTGFLVESAILLTCPALWPLALIGPKPEQVL